MKKNYVMVAALLFLVLGLGNSVPVSKLLKTADKRGTPENSVLVYGRIAPVAVMNFLQMDSRFEADRQDADFLSKSVFCLAPVAPGSFYMVGYTCTEVVKEFLRTPYYKGGFYTLRGSMWDFRAPSKPGLYYYGSYDFMKSDDEGERIATNEDPKKEELECLKVLKKELKKTSWEEVIQKRIDELKGESK